MRWMLIAFVVLAGLSCERHPHADPPKVGDVMMLLEVKRVVDHQRPFGVYWTVVFDTPSGATFTADADRVRANADTLAAGDAVWVWVPREYGADPRSEPK